MLRFDREADYTHNKSEKGFLLGMYNALKSELWHSCRIKNKSFVALEARKECQGSVQQRDGKIKQSFFLITFLDVL